jgi:hypothetical protein
MLGTLQFYGSQQQTKIYLSRLFFWDFIFAGVNSLSIYGGEINNPTIKDRKECLTNVYALNAGDD